MSADHHATQRVRKFVTEYEQLSGLDPEMIYGLHRGHARQAEIRLSDLKSLLHANERLREALQGVVDCRDRPCGFCQKEARAALAQQDTRQTPITPTRKAAESDAQ